MTDIVERLRDHRAEDHTRGCQGREYGCSCDYDIQTDVLLGAAADEIARLREALDDVDNRRDEYALKRKPLESEIERLRALILDGCAVFEYYDLPEHAFHYRRALEKTNAAD